MKIFIETDRLILREIVANDAEGMFALDADADVHRYLGNNPIKTQEEARKNIDFIRQQYIDNGIGRWAVVEKDSDKFIGWAGLKFVTEETNRHINFYDIGYRFIKKYWGKGYATEAAKATLTYGFEKLSLPTIFAMADVNNTGSNRILTKIGLKYVEQCFHQGIDCYWYHLHRKDCLQSALTGNRNNISR